MNKIKLKEQTLVVQKIKAIAHCASGGAVGQWMFSPEHHLLFHEENDLLNFFLHQYGIRPSQFGGCVLYFRDSAVFGIARYRVLISHIFVSSYQALNNYLQKNTLSIEIR